MVSGRSRLWQVGHDPHVTKELTERQIHFAIKADLTVGSHHPRICAIPRVTLSLRALRIVAKARRSVLMTNLTRCPHPRSAFRPLISPDLIHRLRWPKSYSHEWPFEFQHDVRLPASRRKMSWRSHMEEVAPSRGLATPRHGAHRELLRTPCTQDYLDLACREQTSHASCAAGGSVEKDRSGDRKIRRPRCTLGKVATQMSADEALWSRSALADELPSTRALERVEFATKCYREPNCSDIRYYEFTLARSFARDNSLAQYVLARQDACLSGLLLMA